MPLASTLKVWHDQPGDNCDTCESSSGKIGSEVGQSLCLYAVPSRERTATTTVLRLRNQDLARASTCFGRPAGFRRDSRRRDGASSAIWRIRVELGSALARAASCSSSGGSPDAEEFSAPTRQQPHGVIVGLVNLIQFDSDPGSRTGTSHSSYRSHKYYRPVQWERRGN